MQITREHLILSYTSLSNTPGRIVLIGRNHDTCLTNVIQFSCVRAYPYDGHMFIVFDYRETETRCYYSPLTMTYAKRKWFAAINKKFRVQTTKFDTESL